MTKLRATLTAVLVGCAAAVVLVVGDGWVHQSGADREWDSSVVRPGTPPDGDVTVLPGRTLRPRPTQSAGPPDPVTGASPVPVLPPAPAGDRDQERDADRDADNDGENDGDDAGEPEDDPDQDLDGDDADSADSDED